MHHLTQENYKSHNLTERTKLEGRKSICEPRCSFKMTGSNVKCMQIIVNDLKPTTCVVIFKGYSNVLDARARCSFTLHSGLVAHILTATLNLFSFHVTQPLSKAMLSAEPGLLDAEEIVNPSVCSGGGAVPAPAQQTELCSLWERQHRKLLDGLCDMTLSLSWRGSLTRWSV